MISFPNITAILRKDKSTEASSQSVIRTPVVFEEKYIMVSTDNMILVSTDGMILVSNEG